MAAALPRPTFTGFVATTVDAAYLLEAAAVAHTLPRVDARPDKAGFQHLAQSGTVVVYRISPGLKRWRDDLHWTARRSLGQGFDIYRETTADVAERPNRVDLADERARRDALEPYFGPNAGKVECKQDGLIKKTIPEVVINGQAWGLVAYYTLADIATGRLERPRAAMIGRMLEARGLNREFWRQPRKLAGRTVVMADDQNAGTAANWQSWHKTAAVEPMGYVLPPAAPPAPAPAPAAPFVPAPPPLLHPALPFRPVAHPAGLFAGPFLLPAGPPAAAAPAPLAPSPPPAPAAANDAAAANNNAVGPASLNADCIAILYGLGDGEDHQVDLEWELQDPLRYFLSDN